MKGIILAAGRGSRMGNLTNHLPKCRTLFSGKELIRWQFEALEIPEIDQVAIGRGYLANTFNMDVKYFENKKWDTTNMVSSLLTAKDWLKAHECVISYSDIVYSKNIVKELVRTKGDIIITYDPDWLKLWQLRFDDPLVDAESFKLDGNKLIEIGNRAKSIEEIDGQYMGLLKISPNGWGIISDYLKNCNTTTVETMDMTQLLQKLITQGNEIIVTKVSEPWYEIDTKQDLDIYTKSFDRNHWK